jgi:hypothetical protein
MIIRIWHGLVSRVTGRAIIETSRTEPDVLHYIGMRDLDGMVDEQVQVIGCHMETRFIRWQHYCGPLCVEFDNQPWTGLSERPGMELLNPW